MFNIRYLLAFLFLTTPAFAGQTVTINWPLDAREGDQYVADLRGEDTEVVGSYVISVSPDDTSILDVDLDGATTVCIWTRRGSRRLTALAGTYFNNPIALTPERGTGHICLSLFDQKSTVWQAQL